MSSVNVLIVDDKPENLYLLRALLTGNGFSVTCANEGGEALRAARSSRPDLIVSDILMPGMDGFALCREWKKDPDLRTIPFVFYTATYTDPRDEKLALDMGADRFLIKPTEPEVFM
jgi:CheY-like chemotaxis protein